MTNRIVSMLSRTCARATLCVGLTCARSADAAAADIVRVPGFGQSYSNALRVNDSGLVVGDAFSPITTNRAFVFNYFAGTTLNLDAQITTSGPSSANAINNAGDVVGVYANPSHASHAFLYSSRLPAKDLGTFGGSDSTAWGINDSGVVVGQARTSGPTRTRAFRYADSGPMQDLGDLGGPTSLAFDVNSIGDIVGVSDTSSTTGTQHAFVYRNVGGPMQDLGTLMPDGWSEAHAINDAGTIVGYAKVSSGYHAFRHNGVIGSPMQDLTPGSSGNGQAFDTNASGFTVGWHIVGGRQRGVLWTPEGVEIDLDAWLDSTNQVEGAKWDLVLPRSINSGGLIVGSGIYNGSDLGYAFVLDASALVPEPSGSVAIFASTLGLLIAKRRRSNTSAA